MNASWTCPRALEVPEIVDGVVELKAIAREKKMPLRRQLLLQFLCLMVGLTILFPIFWVINLALDPSGARPKGLNLFPAGASLDNFAAAINQPSDYPVSFIQLAFNSLMIALSTSFFSVFIGVHRRFQDARYSVRCRYSAW